MLAPPEARQAFRYLKRGAFPPRGIHHFTVGRNQEFALLRKALDGIAVSGSSHLFLEANYGHGKSHMLKATEALALDCGFAVSWVTITLSIYCMERSQEILFL